MAFYLKYRPQNLDEIIGQDQVKQILSAAYQNNKLSHAYLLVGPRGTGKTSTARILAKMVNCEFVNRGSLIVDRKDKNDKQYTINDIPCNKCNICLSITDGSNLDLIEIDAASNRGIEDIRSLREKIKLAPSTSKKKVYIIDEVHMLTTEAFNALLKTLEEPPDHALFILATTDASKIPATILSRVQRLDFKMAATKELLQVLEKITKAEKIDIEETALKLLAGKAEGSFRDGVKLLDQLSSNNGKITAKSLQETLKTTQFDDLLDLLKNFGSHNTKNALLTLSKQIDQGIDIRDLVLSLMDILRNMVFIKNELGEQLVKSNFTEDKYEDLVKIAESFSTADLVADLGFLQKALEKLKFASIPSLPLELAVVEMTQSVISSSLSLRAEGLSEVPPKADESKDLLQIRDFSPVKPDPSDKKEESINIDDSPDILKIKEKWTFVLETIRPFNFSLEALLRSTNISSCSDSEVIMEVPYSFHQRILEAPKNRDLLESIFSDVLGRQVKVATVLGNRPARKEDIANIEVAADDEIIRVAAAIFESEPVN
ncbi:MAG: DNA polymerase III subunit gamma/tau [Candidatus Daviesbacteria bacterium]|nr:DNA polymerase III subunit gamma/tau [Candidatus Daviesbacteria bacterium]